EHAQEHASAQIQAIKTSKDAINRVRTFSGNELPHPYPPPDLSGEKVQTQFIASLALTDLSGEKVRTRFIASASPFTSPSSSPFAPTSPYAPSKNLTQDAQRHRKLLQRHITRKYLRRDRLGKQRSFER